jgi:hypothetical protein
MNLDELELELRKLPEVRWAAFSEVGDRLLVQLHAMHDVSDDVALEATRIAARHCDVPIAVEVVRWVPRPGTHSTEIEPAMVPSNGAHAVAARPSDGSQRLPIPAPPRMRHSLGPEILGVLTMADTDEVEVHLGDGTTRTIGRAPMSGGLISAADATLEAVRGGFTIDLPVGLEWARTIETDPGGRKLVAVALALPHGNECYGMSSADTEMEGAARATLDALRRNVRVARRNGESFRHQPRLLPPPPLPRW